MAIFRYTNMMPTPNLFPANSSSFRERRLVWNAGGGGGFEQFINSVVPEHVRRHNEGTVHSFPQFTVARHEAQHAQDMIMRAQGRGPDRATQVWRNISTAVGSALMHLGTYIQRYRQETAQQRKQQAQQQALSPGAAPTIPDTIPTTEQEMRNRISTFNGFLNREMNLILEGNGPYTLSWNTIDIPRERVNHDSVAKRVNALGFPAGTFDADSLTLSSISLLQVHQVVQALRPAPVQTPAQQNAAKAGIEQRQKADVDRPASRSPFTPQETQALRIDRFIFGWRQGFVETAIRNLPTDKRANVVQALSRVTANEPALGELLVAVNGMPRDQRTALATISPAQLREMLRNPAANPAGLSVPQAQAATAALTIVRNSPARITAVQTNIEPMLELIQNM